MTPTRLVLVTALFFAATPLSASASNMSGAEIKQLISNKKVLLKTRWGGFPLRYSASKRVTGDGSGLGLARFFAPKETGKWWVSADRLCQKFPTWYRGRSFCFSVQKTGTNKIRWIREDGYSGTATISR